MEILIRGLKGANSLKQPDPPALLVAQHPGPTASLAGPSLLHVVKNWWLVLVRGIVSILFGIVAFRMSSTSAILIALALGTSTAPEAPAQDFKMLCVTPLGQCPFKTEFFGTHCSCLGPTGPIIGYSTRPGYPPVLPAPNSAGPSYAPTLSAPSPSYPKAHGTRILETGYACLRELGGEVPGYGLYSYLLIPAASNSSIALLRELFKAFPPMELTSTTRPQTNILYIPFHKEKEIDYQKMASIKPEIFLSEFYDFRLARSILNHLCNPPFAVINLNHLCNPPFAVIKDICEGDLSRGPFIFTYATPASKSEPVPPPYLLVDLRDVHERAMREFVAAYAEQIKRTDFSDRERLDTLRLRILTITLTAADWTSPFPKALADIVHSVFPDSRR